MDARYHVVTDLETTGTKHGHHEIIQIARTVVDVRDCCLVPNSSMSAYVVPDHWDRRTKEAMDVNKISWDLLDNEGLTLKEALSWWSTGINWSKSIVAAWGIDFELGFLEAAYESVDRVRPYGYRGFDVRSGAFLFSARTRDMEYRGLADAARHLGLAVDESRLHDAAYDVQLTSAIYLDLLSNEDNWSV